MKSIATKLGLTPEASEDAILGAVESLTNRANTAETALATDRQALGLVTAERDTLLGQVFDAQYKNRFKPDKLADARQAFIANRQSFEATLSMLAEPEKPKKNDGNLMNRAEAKPPTGKQGSNDPKDLTNRAESEIRTYRLANRCSYQQARDAVRASNPELFAPAEAE
jgi:hypothetical protein